MRHLLQSLIMKSCLWGAVSAVLFTFVTVSANAAFIGRLPATPGDIDYQAYYDDQLDITWTADASLSGLRVLVGFGSGEEWAANLILGGVSGWRVGNISEYDFMYAQNGVTASEPDPFHLLTSRVSCISRLRGS